MIAPSKQPVISADAAGSSEASSPSLPGYGRLVSVACGACSPLLALALIGSRLWLAVSLAIGLALSVIVCGMLHLFVARGMDYFAGTIRERRGAAGKNGSVVLFAVLLPVKFVLIGLLGWALLTLHSINYLAVLTGFGLAQAAIAVTAAKHFKKR